MTRTINRKIIRAGQEDSASYPLKIHQPILTMSEKQVAAKLIYPSNFQCGDVLGGSDGNQYTVTDIQKNSEQKYAVLSQLSEEERVKSEFLDGRVIWK